MLLKLQQQFSQSAFNYFCQEKLLGMDRVQPYAS